ncbi:MAG TPA: NAD(P)H-dependent oxidoreductase [Thiobacillus sp.]|nr:NAD(P)H-dependent oxidoreductase [Thiobacillus sp.]
MLLPAIQSRYACHDFAPDPAPSPEQLSELIEAGRLAPSAFGLEPWRFIVVTDPGERAAVAHACFDQPAARSAPAFIVVVALVDALEPDSDYVRDRFEAEARGGDPAPIHAAYRAFHRPADIAAWACGQCNLAAENILLQAAYLGLGSCPIGGYDEAALRAAMEIPAGEVPALVIAVGRCAEGQPERVRKLGE